MEVRGPCFPKVALVYILYTWIYCQLAERIEENGKNNPVYKTAKETLMYRTAFWTLWERERVGSFGRMALKHV